MSSISAIVSPLLLVSYPSSSSSSSPSSSSRRLPRLPTQSQATIKPLRILLQIRPSSQTTTSPRCSSSQPQNSKQKPSEEFERLFSNLNQATMKREPGSVTSGVLLVAGTTVGAGILAIPAVTQEAGFFASAITCILCWIYMVVTGLLIAEVNVNTMCELGSGGVSLVSMAMRTLGKTGVQVACWSYIFIHYALLVAYVARSSDILTNSFDGRVPRSFQLFLEAYATLEASGLLAQ